MKYCKRAACVTGQCFSDILYCFTSNMLAVMMNRPLNLLRSILSSENSEHFVVNFRLIVSAPKYLLMDFITLFLVKFQCFTCDRLTLLTHCSSTRMRNKKWDEIDKQSYDVNIALVQSRHSTFCESKLKLSKIDSSLEEIR